MAYHTGGDGFPGGLFGDVGGACMASDVPGDRMPGLMASGVLTGLLWRPEGVGRVPCFRAWHNPGRVPYAIRGGYPKIPPGVGGASGVIAEAVRVCGGRPGA